MATYYVRTDGHDTASGANNTNDASTGAFISPGKAASVAVSGDTIYVKSGTYTLTTSTPGALGPVLLANAAKILMEGFNTSPGDLGTPPVIIAGSLTALPYIVKSQAGVSNNQLIVNISVSGNNQATPGGSAGSGNIGFLGAATYGSVFWLCNAFNCGTEGFNGVQGTCIACIADTNAVGFLAVNNTNMLYGCVARNNTSYGFSLQTGRCVRCIAYSNGGNGFDLGFNDSCCACISYANTGAGFHTATYSVNPIIDCIAYNNTTYQFDNSTFNDMSIINCAADNSHSGDLHTALLRSAGGGSGTSGLIRLTGDPFVNAPTDFSLNNTAGAGALLRAAALAVAGGQLQNNDLGAVQSTAAAAGGLLRGGFWGG